MPICVPPGRLVGTATPAERRIEGERELAAAPVWGGAAPSCGPRLLATPTGSRSGLAASGVPPAAGGACAGGAMFVPAENELTAGAIVTLASGCADTGVVDAGASGWPPETSPPAVGAGGGLHPASNRIATIASEVRSRNMADISRPSAIQLAKTIYGDFE